MTSVLVCIRFGFLFCFSPADGLHQKGVTAVLRLSDGSLVTCSSDYLSKRWVISPSICIDNHSIITIVATEQFNLLVLMLDTTTLLLQWWRKMATVS